MITQLVKKTIILGLIFNFFTCGDFHNNSNNNGNIRIVSLAQSITKQLMELQLDSSIVGATTYCDIALQNPELVVGTSTEVNIEKILLLKPDFVFATGLTSQTTISSLKNSGINVYVNPKMDSYQTICKHFLEIAKMLGKEEMANDIIKNSNRKLDSLKNSIPKQSRKQSVFFQIGANPIFTVVPNTYMNDLITFANCENIASDFTIGTITRENVIQKNPDIIIIVTMGNFGEEEKKTWESYKNLNAAKNKKIFIIESETACTPTVLSFTKSLEQIINLIYK
jgi:iron complex transport system substrate-binding protein